MRSIDRPPRTGQASPVPVRPESDAKGAGSNEEKAARPPEPRAVAAFRELHAAVGRNDRRAAGEARRKLHALGWWVRPPSRWGVAR